MSSLRQHRRFGPYHKHPRPRFDYKSVSGGFYAGWGSPKLVMYDPKANFYVVWWGGTGVHAFSLQSGTEISFWNVHSAGDDPTRAEIVASIRRRMKEGDYP